MRTDSDAVLWLIRERVVEACALVDSLRRGPTDPDALATLEHLAAELRGLLASACEDDPEAAEACAAGSGALEAIQSVLEDALPSRSAA